MLTDIHNRFMDKVSPEPNSGCWLWDASIMRLGYGNFRIGLKIKKAHRVSYELHIGAIPEGMDVLHKCDNRACVNPNHLCVGSHWDNMQDMVAKKRHPTGVRHGFAKLDEAKVLEIRASKLKDEELADIYGVDHATIYHVRTRRTWKHV